MKRFDFSKWTLAIYFSAIIIFLIFPVFIIIPISFSNNEFMRFPPEELGVVWYREVFSGTDWMSAAALSFNVAFAAGLVATVVGTMAVIVLERHNVKFKTIISYFVIAPIIVPHIFIALGVFITASRLGLTDNVFILIGSHATIAIPFVILIVGAAYRQLDPTFELAARVLGAGPVRAFFSATFPSLLPGIVAAAIFAFFVSFDELIISDFLLSDRETLPMKIWADLRLQVRPTVAAVSSLLIIVTTVAMGVAEMYRRRGAEMTQRKVVEEADG